MIKQVLKGVAVVLIMTIGTLLVLYLNRSDPWGRIPGKRLLGEEVTGPIEDWSFTEQYTTVTLEVRASDPYSVNTSSLLHDGVLYVPSGFGGESRWAQFLLQDSNMRLRVGQKLYKVRATREENPMLLRELYEGWVQRCPGQAGKTAEEIAQVWFFRIDAR